MAADGAGFDGLSAARTEAFAVLDRRLDRASRAPLAVGLSGGGDSLALLVIVLDWARAAGRPVLALTVDHGLSPDSARWTAQAGQTARALGADWRALIWDGPKPSTGLPAAARRARHALLADAARAAGASVLLLGHTADDVAESELIRRETPTHGLMRDWAPSPVWPEGRGVFLLRPLLRVRRGALRSMLAAQGLHWLEDPGNGDIRYARPRARRALMPISDGPRSQLDLRGPFPLDGGGAGMGEPPGSRRRGVGSARHCGVVTLPVGTFDAGQDLSRLARAICCAAGRERPPVGAAVARLAARAATGASGSATLGGARVVFDGGAVRLYRELGRRPAAPVALEPGEPQVFDGRFEIETQARGWRVGALAGHAGGLSRADRGRLAAVPALARPALPVLLDQGGVPCLPHPFGAGPGEARSLVWTRLAAAFGRIDTEGDLAPDLPVTAVHGA